MSQDVPGNSTPCAVQGLPGRLEGPRCAPGWFSAINVHVKKRTKPYVYIVRAFEYT